MTGRSDAELKFSHGRVEEKVVETIVTYPTNETYIFEVADGVLKTDGVATYVNSAYGRSICLTLARDRIVVKASE